MLEQVAQVRNIASRGTCEIASEFCVWMTPPITTVPPSVTRTCVVAAADQGGVSGSVFVAKIGQSVFHVHVEEDRSLRGDLRSHRQPQEGIDIGSRGRSANGGRRHDRYFRTLFHHRLNIVLRDHARTGKNLQQARDSAMVKTASDSNVVGGVDEDKPLVGAVAPRF